MQFITEAMAQTESTAPQASPTPAPAQTAPKTSQGTVAPADGAPQPPSMPDLLSQLIPILVIMAIVYAVVIRPRSRREKEQLAQLRNVRRGDTLVTSSGIIAKVTKSIDENEVEVEIAPNVRIRLLRTAISEVRAKGEPVKDQPAGSKS